MNKIKVKLDRETLSSDYIESKQDFKQVASQVQASNAILKSTWFYGGIGLASLATIVTLSVKTSNPLLNEENATLKQSITTASFISSELPKKKQEKQVTAVISESDLSSTPVMEENASVKTISKETKSISTVAKKKTIAEDVPLRGTVDTKTQVNIPKPPPLNVKEKKNFIPKISGVYNGEIKIHQLCNAGLEVNDDIEIIGFTLNYSTNRGDKALKVSGDRVPGAICNEMYSYGIDQMIFIMDIVGRNSEGELLRFVPMNLTAVVD